jgi:hypothetical protein
MRHLGTPSLILWSKCGGGEGIPLEEKESIPRLFPKRTDTTKITSHGGVGSELNDLRVQEEKGPSKLGLPSEMSS